LISQQFVTSSTPMGATLCAGAANLSCMGTTGSRRVLMRRIQRGSSGQPEPNNVMQRDMQGYWTGFIADVSGLAGAAAVGTFIGQDAMSDFGPGQSSGLKIGLAGGHRLPGFSGFCVAFARAWMGGPLRAWRRVARSAQCSEPSSIRCRSILLGGAPDRASAPPPSTAAAILRSAPRRHASRPDQKLCDRT
jgi:hypothetical protein